MKWTLLSALMLALMLALPAAAAQSTEETTEQEREWLIMVHMTADNDLESFAIDDINEMEVGLKNAIDEEANERIEAEKAKGTTLTPEMEEQIRQQTANEVASRATVVVQIDRWDDAGSRYDDTSNGNWTGTRRYVITPDMTDETEDPRKIDSTMVQDLGEVNMGDPQVAEDFVTWATAEYSANNTAVIYWNHGSGWKWEEGEVTESEEATKSVGYDYSSNYDALTPMEIDKVHSSLPKMDIMGYDACLMQMAEHGYQYQDDADIIIGSEEIEPGAGWTYDAIVKAAFKGASPEELAKTVVDSYDGPTLSAIKTEKIPEITNKLDALLAELSSAEDKDKMLEAYEDALRFEDSEYGDLYTFADSIEKANLGENITSAAGDLKSSIDGAVIAKHSERGYEKAGGMSIWMPLEKDKTNSTNYAELGMSESTQWDEHVEEEIETKEQISGETAGYDQWWWNLF